jgi:hypothetical protein
LVDTDSVSFFYYRPCDADPRAAKRRNRGGSPAWKVFRRGIQMVDGGELLVMYVGDGVGDDVLQMTATSNPWSLTTGASRGDGEVRLEVTAASVVIESSFHRIGPQKKRERERTHEEQRGESGSHHRLVSDGFQWRSPVAPARIFRSLAARIREGKGRDRRGGAGLYRGKVLKTIYSRK